MKEAEFKKIVDSLREALVEEEPEQQVDEESLPIGFYYDPGMLRGLTKVDSGVFRRLLGIKE